jgi:hypothetical protein
MQYVNDDMDDLFRRAAENYPLDTKSADWGKVAAELEKKYDKIEKPGSNNRKYLWLLLLLPFSFLCNHIFNADTSELVKSDQNNSNTYNKSSIQIQETKTIVPSGQWNKVELSQQNKVDIEKQNQSNSIVNSVKVSKVRPNYYVDLVNENKVRVNVNSVSLNNGADELKERSSLPSVVYTKNAIETFKSLNNYPSFSIISHPGYPDAIVKESQKLIDPVKNRSKRIYAAIMGGIDATSIKFQKVSNAGYAIGLLLGYKLNDRWSLESGLFHDKKYYYSEGQYLNTSKMYILPGTKINSLDGNCSMWEVPIQARYDFKNSGKKVWFTTLGLSSYFMKKENYEYTYSYISTGQTYDKYRTYNNASKHFFSVITLSGGVINPINKSFSVRIEPYFKIPVKGVGVGSISLQSAGLQVGVSKTLF